MKLTRDEALAHPALGESWSVVEFIAEADGSVGAAVYGRPIAD